jgi:hypothetical protein
MKSDRRNFIRTIGTSAAGIMMMSVKLKMIRTGKQGKRYQVLRVIGVPQAAYQNFNRFQNIK